MNDIQEIYAVLLARQYAQTALFHDLRGQIPEGREVRANCPMCQGRGRHFSYSLDEPLWICYKTGERGDWIRYLEWRSGIPFRDAVVYLADQAHVSAQSADRESYEAYVRKADLLDEIQDLFQSALLSTSEQQVMQHLAVCRRWSEDEVRQMELGLFDEDGLRKAMKKCTDQEVQATGFFASGPLDKVPAWVTVPWRDRAGRTAAFTMSPAVSEEERRGLGLRSYYYGGVKHGSDDTVVFPGTTFTRASRGNGSVVLIQDPMSALHATIKGVTPSPISVGESAPSRAHLDALERCGVKTITLLTRGSQATQSATLGMVEAVRKQSAIRPLLASLPEGIASVDDLLNVSGVEIVNRVVAQAQAWPKWLARYVATRQKNATDTDLELVTARLSDAYRRLADSVEKRQFREAAAAVLGSSVDELESRLDGGGDTVHSHKVREVLNGLASEVIRKSTAGDLSGAETSVGLALARLRQLRRGLALEAYSVDVLERDVRRPGAIGLQTGYEDLDRLIAIPQGAVTAVVGGAGHGKTAFLLNLLTNMLRRYPDEKFAFFSYEEAKRSLALKMIMREAGEVLDEVHNLSRYAMYLSEKGHTNPAIESAVARYEEWSATGRLILSDQLLSIDLLVMAIEQLASYGRLGAVCIDHVGEVSDRLAEVAARVDVPVIVSAPLTRLAHDAEQVRLEDAAEVAGLENASLVLGLWSDEEQTGRNGGAGGASQRASVAIQVLKNRTGEKGGRADVVLDRPVLRIVGKGSDPSAEAVKKGREGWSALIEARRS